MTIYVWGAIAVVILTLAALIRRYDTKLVLLIAGLAMCCLSMNPMAAFQQFDKSMTNSALIISICSSMGFAACVTMTKCDLHLVSLLTKPLNKLGILLLPCCMIVTGIASVAIGSLAGLCAAIGPTLVGLMIRAGFRPAMAAAVIISSTLPNYWSPGSTDNIYVAKLANIPVMDMVTYVAPTTLILSALSIVFVMIVCLLFKDYRKEGFGSTGVHPGEDIQKKLPDLPEKPNLLMAFAPLLPIVQSMTGMERLTTSSGEAPAMPAIRMTPAASGDETRPSVAETQAMKPRSSIFMPNSRACGVTDSLKANAAALPEPVMMPSR